MNIEAKAQSAQFYHKGIIKYAEIFFLYLIKEGWLSKTDVVADINCSNGIFAEQISHYVEKVYAIEPDNKKRTASKAACLNRDNVNFVNGTYFKTTLPDDSVDIITVTSGFYSFDRQQFKKECERILKPNGRLILLWNDINPKKEVAAANYVINKLYIPDFNGPANGYIFKVRGIDNLFKDDYIYSTFDNSQQMRLMTFLSRNLSMPFAPKTEDPVFFEYVNELLKLFDKYQANGMITFPYRTRFYIGMLDRNIISTRKRWYNERHKRSRNKQKKDKVNS